MGIITELFGELLLAFFGACVVVMWPPKSALWARWQKIGIGLAIASVAAFAIAIGVLRFRGWSPLTWTIFGLACLLSVSYIIVGNTCRVCHEAAKNDS